MKYANLVTNFVRNWNNTRSETLDILKSLSDKQLQFKPTGEKWQPIFYQFGCIVRTQKVYTKAINEGQMDYTWFDDSKLMSKNDFQTQKSLIKALKLSDKEWIEAIRKRGSQEDFQIKWPGFNMNLLTHITVFISHERLHHGQLISYFTLAGFELPKDFKNNWAL